MQKNKTYLIISAALFLLFVAILPTLANADYLPTMPPATGVFGAAIAASPTFNDGYHWDNTLTEFDERDIPSHYRMPSPMAGYTAGDALDYHWVWVNGVNHYVVWEFADSVDGVRVYPSQDHGPYLGQEFDEYRVDVSNDQATWVPATEIALYYDDINNVRTHDGVKDYSFDGAYRYIKITSIICCDFEIDAVEALPPAVVEVSIDVKPGSDPNCFNLNGHGVIPVAILGSTELDVQNIDVSSLSFNGLALRVRGNKGPLCSIEEANGDLFPDLVCHFEDDPTQWIDGTEMAILTGSLLNGTPIEGTDSICIVP